MISCRYPADIRFRRVVQFTRSVNRRESESYSVVVKPDSYQHFDSLNECPSVICCLLSSITSYDMAMEVYNIAVKKSDRKDSSSDTCFFADKKKIAIIACDLKEVYTQKTSQTRKILK